MSEHRIASRYAKSLLDLAVEQNKLDKIIKDIDGFQVLCNENRDLVLLLKNPIISHYKKLDILKKIFSGKVDVLTLSFFELITKKAREGYLPAVAVAFKEQYFLYKGITESTIETVVPISAALRKEIKEVVTKLTGMESILTEKINADLIGGYVLRIGDRQIDDSVSNKLRELRLSLIDNQYVSKL